MSHTVAFVSHAVSNPVVVTGAFERHNFGDLLMGRVLAHFAEDAGMTALPASVLAADLRSLGGSTVHAFADLAPHLTADVPIVHVGGETIPCLLHDALRMNVPAGWPARLAADLARECNPSGLDSRALAYLTPPDEVIRGQTYHWSQRFFHAQGASTLAHCDPAIHTLVCTHLRDALDITAREETSVAAVRDAGFTSTRFAWDAGVLQPCLQPLGRAALDEIPTPPSSGPLLIQANAAFLDAHGASLAPQIAAVTKRFSSVRLGLAGLAAHHDTLASIHAFAQLLATHGCHAVIADNPHADAISSEIQQAACLVATSLHYRILALTHAVPRVSLTNAKTAGWARSCDPDFPANCPANAVADAVTTALNVPSSQCRERTHSARQEALAAMDHVVARLADAARRPAARCHLPHHPHSLAPEYLVLPRAWIDAAGTYATTLATTVATTTHTHKSNRQEIRRLRSELNSLHRSTPARLARLIKKLRPPKS